MKRRQGTRKVVAEILMSEWNILFQHCGQAGDVGEGSNAGAQHKIQTPPPPPSSRKGDAKGPTMFGRSQLWQGKTSGCTSRERLRQCPHGVSQEGECP